MELRPNHFLIDYENTQEIDFGKLSDPGIRLHLFLGGTQSKLPTELVQKIHAHASQIELIACPGTGRNALDFLLAFHAGRLSLAEPGAFLHFISKDKGFDPLIAYLKSQKILAARSDTFAEAPLFHAKPDAKPLSIPERIARAQERLNAMSKSRPRKRKTLLSTLAAHFKQLTTEEIASLVTRLEKARFLTIDAKDNITYQPATP